MLLSSKDENHRSIDAYTVGNDNDIAWSIYSVDVLAYLYPPLWHEESSLVKAINNGPDLGCTETKLVHE